MSSESGFTVIEIVVAFILIALLLQVFVSTFIFSGKQISKWKKQVIRNNELQLISKQLSKDLIDIESVSADDKYTIHTSRGDSIIYNLVDASLFRNDHQMNRFVTIDSISILSLTTICDTLNEPVDSLNIISTSYSLYCSSDGKELNISNVIMPRNLLNLSTRNLSYEQKSEKISEEQ
jgi:ABC-type Na+ efflux pump permease subunit